MAEFLPWFQSILIVQWLVNYFLKAQFEDIKKIVDQMWETLSENLKKVSDALFWLKT